MRPRVVSPSHLLGFLYHTVPARHQGKSSPTPTKISHARGFQARGLRSFARPKFHDLACGPAPDFTRRDLDQYEDPVDHPFPVAPRQRASQSYRPSRHLLDGSDPLSRGSSMTHPRGPP